jgi:small subunit ribosomal protein S19e
LEKLGYVEKVEGKGRVISSQGMKKLDVLSTQILKELVVKEPQLKKYS